MFEMYESTFEIYIEDKLINRQIMNAPKEILMLNFVQTVNQIGNDQRPMRVKMIVPMTIWDNFKNEQKTLDNYVMFSNNTMASYEESKEKDG